MNVGPTARGTFDKRANEALEVYGEWLRLHGRAIYGATRSSFTAPRDCRLTQRGNRLYVHVCNWPFRHLHFDGLGGKVKYAQLLHDASEVHWIDPSGEVDSNVGFKVGDNTLTLELPVRKPDVVVPVVELILKEG
jgi:alpha-L-fucosidase